MWQANLAEIGKGILQGAGSSIFDSWFGRQRPDFSSLLALSLKSFSEDIRYSLIHEVQRIEFEEAIESLKAAQRAARKYNTSPEDKPHLLDKIINDLSTAIANLEFLGPPALGSYMIAVSLEVAIIQELAKRNVRDLAIAVCDIIPSSARHLEKMLEALKTWNKSRFTEIDFREFYGGEHGKTLTYVRLWYEFEGKKYSDSISGSELYAGVRLEQHRIRHIARSSLEQNRIRHIARSSLEQNRIKHIAREWASIFAATKPLSSALNRLKEWANGTGVQCINERIHLSQLLG